MANLNQLESWAIISTGAYFLFRLFGGWFHVNLSLSSKPQRKRYNDQEDVIIIDLEIEKGEFGSVAIYDAQARIQYSNHNLLSPFSGIGRIKIDCKGKLNSSELETESKCFNRGRIRITPNEKTTFSCYFIIPSNEICTIDISVSGRRDFSPFQSQWRLSKISAPNAKTVLIT